jgi:hypothetical protein
MAVVLSFVALNRDITIPPHILYDRHDRAGETHIKSVVPSPLRFPRE